MRLSGDVTNTDEAESMMDEAKHFQAGICEAKYLAGDCSGSRYAEKQEDLTPGSGFDRSARKEVVHKRSHGGERQKERTQTATTIGDVSVEQESETFVILAGNVWKTELVGAVIPSEGKPVKAGAQPKEVLPCLDNEQCGVLCREVGRRRATLHDTQYRCLAQSGTGFCPSPSSPIETHPLFFYLEHASHLHNRCMAAATLWVDPRLARFS